MGIKRTLTLCLLVGVVLDRSSAFMFPVAASHHRGMVEMAMDNESVGPVSRSQCLSAAAAAIVGLVGVGSGATGAAARESARLTPRPRLPDDDKQGSDYLPLGGGGIESPYTKPRMRYSDFTSTNSGLQFKDAKVGTGVSAAKGDRIVMDWEGYTIGYNANVFESKSGPKGGAFDEDKEFYRFILGQGTVIPGLEEGILGMKAGGVRQIVVPPELGYPSTDPKHELVGPKPTTFSGGRALDFVLKNPGLVDKTLLLNVRVVRVDKPGDRGFKGGSR